MCGACRCADVALRLQSASSWSCFESIGMCAAAAEPEYVSNNRSRKSNLPHGDSVLFICDFNTNWTWRRCVPGTFFLKDLIPDIAASCELLAALLIKSNKLLN